MQTRSRQDLLPERQIAAPQGRPLVEQLDREDSHDSSNSIIDTVSRD